ncbi:hypothetical protein KKF29_03875 [Patescibacteria group bacterium]|nr:hypothetical protein [Patescibacteria group bacterium]
MSKETPEINSKIEHEKKKLRARVMLYGGLGCMVLMIGLLALILVFFDKLIDLLG